eukprot:409088_1
MNNTTDCIYQSCRMCVTQSPCIWHIDTEKCINPNVYHVDTRYCIIQEINCPQMIFNPEPSTSATILCITFMFGAIAAIIAKIYYHTYQKHKEKSIDQQMQQYTHHKTRTFPLASESSINSKIRSSIKSLSSDTRVTQIDKK